MFSVLKVAVALVTLTLSAVGASSPPTCNDPDPNHLEELWLSRGTWHESMFNVDRMLELTMTLANVSSQYVDIKLQKLNAGPGCPHAVTAPATPADHQRTLCPTYDVINYDANRVPTTLFEKGCACDTCSAHAAGQGGAGGRRRRQNRRNSDWDSAGDTSLACVPVYYHVKVLRRVNCVNNVYVYRSVLEPLVVACACDRVTQLSAEFVRVHSPQRG